MPGPNATRGEYERYWKTSERIEGLFVIAYVLLSAYAVFSRIV